MNEFKRIGPWGGGGGQIFNLYLPGQDNIPPDNVMSAPLIKCGAWLDAIQVQYSNYNHTQNPPVYSQYVGGTGGEWNVQTALSVGEYITAGGGRTGNYVDHLDLYTNFGRVFHFGSTGGTSTFGYTVDDGYEIIGFFGRAQTYIDAIGFIIRKRL